MTKIKNYRVTLRPREIARWLKKERGLETTPELELLIEAGAREAKAWVRPAAVYTTMTRQTAEKMTAVPLPSDAVALSIAAVSIGPALERERLASESGSPREMLLAALGQEALAQALQFAVRLIGEQAKEEDCEMSPPVSIHEAPAASALATLLGMSRIGIVLDTSNSELPSYARVSYVFWTPMKKGSSRNSAAGTPASRQAGAEKVAA